MHQHNTYGRQRFGWPGPQNGKRVAGRALLWLLLLIFVGYGLHGYYSRPRVSLPEAADSAPASVPKKPDPVLLYTTSACEPCDRARAWMKGRKVRFEERNVEKWPPYQKEVESYGGRIVPVIVVNGEAHHGFLPAHLDAALRGQSTRSR
jgi:glutaredoxin